MRLIDADVLWEWLDNEPWFYNADRDEIALPTVNAIPTVDAEIVVRCKDCKWFANNNGGEWFGCWLFNAIRAVPENAPTPDDFCSKGERKGRDDGHTM